MLCFIFNVLYQSSTCGLYASFSIVVPIPDSSLLTSTYLTAEHHLKRTILLFPSPSHLIHTLVFYCPIKNCHCSILLFHGFTQSLAHGSAIRQGNYLEPNCRLLQGFNKIRSFLGSERNIISSKRQDIEPKLIECRCPKTNLAEKHEIGYLRWTELTQKKRRTGPARGDRHTRLSLPALHSSLPLPQRWWRPVSLPLLRNST